MKRLTPVVVVLSVLIAHDSARAQPAAAAKAQTAEQPTSRKQIIEEMVAAGRAAAGVRSAAGEPSPRPFQTTLGRGGRGLIIAYLIASHTAREGYMPLLKALEAREHEQVGATPSSKGTTTLAMKGLAPKILGVALESGAVTRDVDGTSLTFRATPAGVIKALQNKGLLEMHLEASSSRLQRLASGFSVAASFDASKGPSAGTFTADSHQLTHWSLRYEILNRRDPAGYPELWQGMLLTGEPYDRAAEAMDTQLSAWSEYRDWEAQLIAATERLVDAPLRTDSDLDAAAGRFRSLLEGSMPRLEKLPNLSAEGFGALDVYVAQLTTLQAALDNVYAFAGRGPLLTFDWSTARDVALPDLYTSTLVWEHALGAARRTDLVVNGAVALYRERPAAGARQLKSVDVAVALEHPLGNVALLGQATVSVAARYSRLPDDTVAAAPSGDASVPAHAVGTALKGNIGVFQIKLTVPMKGSGIKVPLSITASNRSELIREKDVRANFGVTFDLDALVGGLIR